jgi:hypothetical protein
MSRSMASWFGVPFEPKNGRRDKKGANRRDHNGSELNKRHVLS